MSGHDGHLALTRDQRVALEARGCSAADWSGVRVSEGFDPTRVGNVRFKGRVSIGPLKNEGRISNALIADCLIGANVRIENVGVRLAGYTVRDGAVLEDVGLIETRPGAAFGNGVVVEVLNEAGGRGVVLFNELSAQFAYLMCVHRYRDGLARKMTDLAMCRAAAHHGNTGSIGAGACISGVGRMIDVTVGAAARVEGASRLVNGTVLSSADAPATVGSDVQAEDFIISEGALVDGGAHLKGVYVGQACRLGRQFSAESSLFFANCELFHGEAVSVFAGPYTVSHHKSTLLIAGMFGFFNAGSGTNQSNHMYKLGPVHEGRLERGTKTGSGAYMMWPSYVGPFSIILGKHTRHVDTSLLPFSLLEATAEGRCSVVPGLTLGTVGTVRDGQKWPARDARSGSLRRDRISFEVLSPLTAGRMLGGATLLAETYASTGRDVDRVTVRGADLKRVLLPRAARTYRQAVESYVLEKVVNRAERAVEGGRPLREAFATAAEADGGERWVDLAGQLMPAGRLERLQGSIVVGDCRSVGDVEAAFDEAARARLEDEWAWVCRTYELLFEAQLGDLDAKRIVSHAEAFAASKEKFLRGVLADAGKEFAEPSRIGFGLDGGEAEAQADFDAVRGRFEDNDFVAGIRAEIEELPRRVEGLKRGLGLTEEVPSPPQPPAPPGGTPGM